MASASIVLRDAAGEVEQIPRRVMIVAARAVKEQARSYAAADVGGDLRMTGFGARGRLRTFDKITGSGAYSHCAIKARPAGMWAILDEGADPHEIRPRRRGGKRGAMAGPGFGPVGGVVQHPGSRGKGTWERVRRWAEREVPKIFADAVYKGVG